MKRIFISSKGFTLVEILAGLALAGLISIIIINILLSGMNSYEKISSDVSLHNDANYVMTLFVNEIYQAKEVKPKEDISGIELKMIAKDMTEVTKLLGFKDNKAFISDREGLSPHYFTDESYIKIDHNKVEIKIVIENEQSEISLENELFIGRPVTE